MKSSLAAIALIPLSALAQDGAASLATENFWPLELFQRGGPVMWLILLGFLAGVSFVLERIFRMQREGHIPKEFDKDVVHIVDTRGVDAGLTLCTEKPTSFGRVLHAALLRHGNSRREMENAVSDEVSRVRHDLSRNTRYIGMLCLLLVPLGLLGTCITLIQSLDQLALSTAADMPAMAHAFSTSLISTAFSLVAAIPLAFFYFILRGRADDIVREIDGRAFDVVITLDRKARQSIRLIEDIEANVDTQDMPGVKISALDLDGEFDDPTTSKHGTKIKSSIHTPAPMPAEGKK